MARDLGPELKAELEKARSSMSSEEYELKLAELENMIRRGETIKLTQVDKVGRWVLAGAAVAVVVWVVLSGGNIFGAAVFAIICAFFVARWGRPFR